MGSVSVETVDPAVQDLVLVMEGGSNFEQRLTAIQDAKKAHEAAYQTLAIGTDAKRALDDAHAKQAQASKELEEARARASAIVRDAEQQRAALLETAEKVRAEALAQASKVSHEAQGLATAMTTQAAAKLAEAQQERDRVSAGRAQLEAVQADLVKQLAAADAKMQNAETTRATFAKKLKALEQAVEAAAKQGA